MSIIKSIHKTQRANNHMTCIQLITSALQQSALKTQLPPFTTTSWSLFPSKADNGEIYSYENPNSFASASTVLTVLKELSENNRCR